MGIIRKKISKSQHLTDIYPQIETNTILCKTLTGLGATYSEIKANRNSIIVVPNIPVIIGKCEQHKKDNLFGVYLIENYTKIDRQSNLVNYVGMIKEK